MKAIDLFIVCQSPTLYVKLFSGVCNSKSWYTLLLGGGIHPSLWGWWREGPQRHPGPAPGHRCGSRAWYASAQLALEQRVPETQSQKLSWFWGLAKNVAHTKE